MSVLCKYLNKDGYLTSNRMKKPHYNKAIGKSRSRRLPRGCSNNVGVHRLLFMLT